MSLELSKQKSEAQAAAHNTGHLPGAQVRGQDEQLQIPAAKERPKPQLSPNGLSVAEYKRTIWYCEAGEGVTLEDVLKTDFWAHVAAKMQPFNRVEVVAYDGSWIADVLVLATGRTAAKVKVLQHHKLDGGYADMSSANKTHEVKHRGPRKWSIIRLSDSSIIKEDINTREDAEKTLSDYLKALGM